MLLLKFPPHFAGGGLQASRLMEALSLENVRVTTLTSALPNHGTPRVEDAYGGKVRRFRTWGSVGLSNHLLGLQSALWLMRHPRWDILHIHGYSYFAVLPILVARLLRRPILLKTTVLGSDGAFIQGRRWFSRWLLGAYRKVDLIIALSKALKRNLEDDRGVECRVEQQSNGVDTQFFRPASEGEHRDGRRQLNLPDNARLVITCGEINPRKNFLQLIQALQYLNRDPVVILIAGPSDRDPEYLKRVEEESERCPSNHEVRILGQLDPAELASLLRLADVFALPSRAEGMPNAVLEALASGVPCLATNIPGSIDILERGGGVLVPLDDPRATGEALDGLLSNETRRAEMAHAAREIAEKHFAFDRVATRYRAFYDGIVQQR
jgi:glycosyltransferase involved in cell wall biosynthesis